MPRTQRWAQVTHSFQSGVLSPSAQDQVDGPAWLSGAADIVNFEVMRDGGLQGRPPFVRSEHTFTAPGWSAVKLSGSSSDPNQDNLPGHIRRESGEPVLGPDGQYLLHKATPLERSGSPASVDVDQALYEVELDKDTPVKAVVWHNVRIQAGEWRTEGENSPLRLNFACEYSADGGTTWTDPAPMVTSDQAEDPFAWGVFAPGRVRRDLVVPLIGQAATEGIALDRVRLRAKVATQAANERDGKDYVELAVGGVSCFSATAPSDETDRKVFFLRRPYRILSWVAGDLPLALVITMEGVSAFLIQGSQVGVPPGGVPRATWYFSPKQIRELTWVTYGKSVLMFHRDFPYPLRAQRIADTQLRVGYLPLENIPEIENLRDIPDIAISSYEQEVVENPTGVAA